MSTSAWQTMQISTCLEVEKVLFCLRIREVMVCLAYSIYEFIRVWIAHSDTENNMPQRLHVYQYIRKLHMHMQRWLRRGWIQLFRYNFLFRKSHQGWKQHLFCTENVWSHILLLVNTIYCLEWKFFANKLHCNEIQYFGFKNQNRIHPSTHGFNSGNISP